VFTEILLGALCALMFANIVVTERANRKRDEHLAEMERLTNTQQRGRDELLKAVDQRMLVLNEVHQCMHAMQERAHLQRQMEEHGLGHVLQQ